MRQLVIVHPGGLSAACWSRLGRLLPSGTTVRLDDLETMFWSRPTVETLAGRLRPVSRDAVLVGWGVAGAVADALATRARPRHLIVLDASAPGGVEPDEPELRRRFEMYLGARGGRGGWEAHVRRALRDHRLVEAYVPSGEPLTVVRAARSWDERWALGWDAFGAVEVLRSAGDHYSMLTDPASVAHLAVLLARWLAPGGYGEQTVSRASSRGVAARSHRAARRDLTPATRPAYGGDQDSAPPIVPAAGGPLRT